MFYLKEGALIQRHHSSTKKKCCLISVTPLLLLSGSDEESETMCHSYGADISSPEILVCLKNTAHCYVFICAAMGWTEIPRMPGMWPFECSRRASFQQVMWHNCWWRAALLPNIKLLVVQRMISRGMKFGWEGEEVRRQGQTSFGGRVGLPAFIPRDWQIGAMGALARMPSRSFP